MGLYDTIKCSYDLGPGFYNRELQTKDLNCYCSQYWISPAGQLYEIDYAGTQDWSENTESNFPLLKHTPNGNHGRVRAVNLFATITVYPSKWDCKYAPYPMLRVHFDGGIIKSVRNLRQSTA